MTSRCHGRLKGLERARQRDFKTYKTHSMFPIWHARKLGKNGESSLQMQASTDERNVSRFHFIHNFFGAALKVLAGQIRHCV